MLSVINGDFREETGIKICTEHTGKMKGLWSLSISPLNPICELRAKEEGSICEKCYSMNMQKFCGPLRKCLEQNMEILTERILDEDELPEINNELKMFRLESFGDVISELQVVNYFHIVEANPLIDCALWTKNPWFIRNAMQEYNLVKPTNLTIIGSSYYLNDPMEAYFRRFDFIDYIFTVYDKEFISKHNVDINCGGRSCAACQKCYRRSHDGYEIREILK